MNNKILCNKYSGSDGSLRLVRDGTPFFSVLVPSYNRPGFISEAIKSITSNTFTNYEIIVSDDCSPRIDEIKHALLPYQELITLREQPTNIGMTGNWNYLVDQAKGEFIIIMGDDDILHTNSLSRLRKYIADYPEFELFAFGFNTIDENGSVLSTRRSPKVLEISCEREKMLRHMLEFNVIPFWTCHPFSICYKREIGQKIKYNKEANIGADLLFLAEFMNAGKNILIIPEVLFSWRKIQKEDSRGGINLSNESINNIKSRYNIIKIINSLSNLHPAIKKISLSERYKKRFLLDSIVLDYSISKKYVAEYFCHDSEMIESVRKLNKNFLHRLQIRSIQMIKYISIFGIVGLFYMLWFVWQRLYRCNYKLFCENK
jgi:glycosyltransferase involved in cell wall biosynthesis